MVFDACSLEQLSIHEAGVSKGSSYHRDYYLQWHPLTDADCKPFAGWYLLEEAPTVGVGSARIRKQVIKQVSHPILAMQCISAKLYSHARDNTIKETG